LDSQTTKINKKNWLNSILLEIINSGREDTQENIDKLSEIEDFAAFFPMKQQIQLKCNRNLSNEKMPAANYDNQIRIDLSKFGYYDVYNASQVTSAILENVTLNESPYIIQLLSKRIESILLRLTYAKRKFIDYEK
jgi:hypothetical protein